MLLFAALIAAYLFGSLSGSLLLGRLVGVDIRACGSGNAGGTNAFRTLGWRFALGVVLIDIGKGTLAAALGQWLAGDVAWLPAACVLAAVAGHTWPVFFGFRGGKGAATLVGGLAWLWPAALLPLVAVWVLVVTTTGYVGLATVLAALLLPLLAALIEPSLTRLAFATISAGFILYTHRENLRRLRQGREHRFERARILWLLFRKAG